jgi:hypothetical protein
MQSSALWGPWRGVPLVREFIAQLEVDSLGFHFDEEGFSVYYGFGVEDVADLPPGKPGVVGVCAATGACFCYVTAAADTKRMLHELLREERVAGLCQYLAEHGGTHFMVEETLEGEARARQLVELYKPIFNVVAAVESALGSARNHMLLERSVVRTKEPVH